MLIGMSRQYKESSNCRMEAQYGLQKKKPLIPLKLVHGYEADGWLGLLLGTSMWYALYGDTLSSESVFEDRMSALSREIGSRGRADAVVSQSSAGVEPEPWIDDLNLNSEADAELVAELQGMKVGALGRRAVAAGVDEAELDEVEEAVDPKAAIIQLIVESTQLTKIRELQSCVAS